MTRSTQGKSDGFSYASDFFKAFQSFIDDTSLLIEVSRSIVPEVTNFKPTKNLFTLKNRVPTSSGHPNDLVYISYETTSSTSHFLNLRVSSDSLVYAYSLNLLTKDITVSPSSEPLSSPPLTYIEGFLLGFLECFSTTNISFPSHVIESYFDRIL